MLVPTSGVQLSNVVAMLIPAVIPNLPIGWRPLATAGRVLEAHNRNRSETGVAAVFYLQEGAPAGVNGIINPSNCLLTDVTLHPQVVLNLLVLLHLIGHVDECLTEVNANHFLELSSNLK